MGALRSSDLTHLGFRYASLFSQPRRGWQFLNHYIDAEWSEPTMEMLGILVMRAGSRPAVYYYRSTLHGAERIRCWLLPGCFHPMYTRMTEGRSKIDAGLLGQIRANGNSSAVALGLPMALCVFYAFCFKSNQVRSRFDDLSMIWTLMK